MAPFLDLVHVRERRCATCGDPLAQPGSRSFIVDDSGDPVNFDAENPPQAMRVALLCVNGHPTTLDVPQDISAEETLMTPDDAPIAVDAQLLP